MAWTEKYANFDLTTGDNDGSSEANAWQTPSAMTTGLGATVSVPTLVNIKRQAVAYDLTASQIWAPAGTALCPLWYRGYTTTPGDGGLWEVRYNGAVASLGITGAYCTVEGIAFLPGATENYSSFSVSGIFSTMIRCKIHCFGSSGGASWRTICCDISLKETYLSAGGSNAGPCLLYGNRINLLNNAGVTYTLAVDCYGRNVCIVSNYFTGNGSSGVDGIFLDRADSGSGMQVVGNIFHGLRSGMKIDEEPSSASRGGVIMGNVFDTMAAYGVERTNTETGFLCILNNYYRACTSGFTNYSEASTLINPALTASPFVDAANGDFRLNETAGGGKVLRAAGFPVSYPYDWTNMADQSVYEGPSPADIAAAVWARTGRELTS